MSLTISENLTPHDEARYISTYLPLVNKVVKQLAWQRNSVMGKDDMQQVALMGLLSSLRRYGHPDTHFSGYAVQRIRGAVLDELRQQDWRPRRLRQKTHKLNDAIREMERELGHTPGFGELNARFALSAEEYQQHRLLDTASEVESLDALPVGEATPAALDSRLLEDEEVLSRTLRDAIASLDGREQKIFALYYQHEMSQKEIAQLLGLTEARVCQLNKAISQKIQRFLAQ